MGYLAGRRAVPTADVHEERLHLTLYQHEVHNTVVVFMSQFPFKNFIKLFRLFKNVFIIIIISQSLHSKSLQSYNCEHQNKQLAFSKIPIGYT